MLKTTRKNLRLNRRAKRDGLVRILGCVQLRPSAFVVISPKPNPTARLLKLRACEPFTNEFANERHACLATNQNHLIQIRRLQFRIAECPHTMLSRSFDNIARQRLQFSTCEFVTETEI